MSHYLASRPAAVALLVALGGCTDPANIASGGNGGQASTGTSTGTSTSTAVACVHVTTSDQFRTDTDVLPVGACAGGDACDLIVRPCPCQGLPRIFYHCACGAAGQWACAVTSQDASACLPVGDAGSACPPDGGACHGDQAAWDGIKANALDCTQSSDCCVVVNGCLNAAQVVAAKDQAAAAAAWPYCDDLCTGCIAPAIDVGCVNGKCVGQNVDNANPPPPDTLRQTHCGVDPITPTDPKVSFTCGG